VIINEVSADQAHNVLERLRGNVEQHAFPQVGQVTVSIGYTMIDHQDLPTRIIEEADKALYYAKEHGRNQVRDFRALREEGAVEDNQHDGSIELF
jgi:diguanylate cyclase (GGDEF)-like protein